MAKEKVAGLMSTEIGLNTTKATESLSQLKSAVKDSTNEWKQMESQLKTSGDVLGASEAKYKGLSQSVEAQKDVLQKLRQEQAEVNRSTEAGEATYQKYASQITQAESKLASLNAQTEKALKSYDYQKSGLADLNDEIKRSNDLTNARVKRLEAEGKTEEANKVQIDGLSSVQSKYTKILEIQKDELEKLGASGDKNSKAYKLQELRVEQTGAKIAETTNKIKALNHTDVKPDASGITSTKAQLKSLNNVLDNTHRRFKSVLMGNIVATGITSTLSDIKSKFTGAMKAGVEYNKEMQSLSVSMDNFTNGDDKLSKALIGNVKALKEESGYATDTVSLLTKKTYGLTKSADGAKTLSDAFVNLGRATGQSDESLQGIIKKFSQVNASGQITTGSLTKMEKSLPGFNAALATSMGKSRDEINKLASDGKLSMADLSKAIETMSDSKPHGLDNYYTTLDGFSNHLEEKYKSLSGKITSGFFQSNNDFLKNMSKSLDGKEVETAFDHVGDSANKAVNTIANAFSKTFKGTKNPVADIANGVADQIEKLGNFVSTHSKDIKNFFEMVKNIGGAGFKLTGDAIKTALPFLEKFGDFASKHPKDVKLMAEMYLGLNVALKGTFAVLKGVEKAKALGSFISDTRDNVASLTRKIKDFSLAQTVASAKSKVMTAAMKAQTLAQKAMNLAMKANPIGLLIVAITALVAGFVLLYKHNKKFRQFVDGLVKSAKQFFEGITKWFGNAWSSVTKGYNSFTRIFSKGWHSFTDGIGRAWNNTWSYVSNVFDKYINIYKRVIKTFTDFFTGNWGNLGKDIRGIWNALWDYVESIFGKKAGSIKHGIEGFGSKIWSTFQTIKDKVSGFWSDMWNVLKDFARDGINNVIGVINNGIGGINTVIHTFGGKKEAIGKIPKFANGTKGAPKGLAIVNDAPGEHYQEAIIDNSGRATVLEGRNRLVNFSGGETVIPAHALPKFAHGTDNWLDTAIGWISDKWDKLTEFIAHPIKALGNIMNKAVSGIAGSPLVTNIAPAMANGLVQGIADPIVNMFKSLKKKHEDEDVVAQAGEGAMSKESFNKTARKAADIIGEHLSGADLAQLWSQAMFESNVNPSINTGYDDHDGTGKPRGLFQYKVGTFNAWKYPGHNNILSALDQFLAVFNMVDWRSALAPTGVKRGWGPWGAKRFADGGWINSRTFAEMGEEGFPEVVIPMNPSRKPRANQLLAEANQRINGAQSQQVIVQSDTAQLEQKFDNVITLLSLMLGVNQDQLKAMQDQGGINLPNLMNQMGMAQAAHNYQSI
ncbi:tape measure protein [Weissella confusa]|uniref:tape measure protein n=1 Tax=Weissella confusa TaxID=1583 RepID=UPI0018F24633|nr:tape measure protein [Weissella confusa]MBJ7681046.1 tape measure protein [Weissella confusa]MBJ7683233.1 tape measure protein [Weissella confusa]MBJ7701826.1 tape measure protein [Weissella confusa]